MITLIKKRDLQTGRILPQNYDLNKIIICTCGCKQRIILNRGHFYRKHLPNYLPHHCPNTWIKKGSPSPMKGKKHSEETKRLISQNNARISWNKGTHLSGMNDKKHSEETKQKMSKSAKRRGFSKQHWERLMSSHIMNYKKSKIEIKFEEIINKNNLPYKFVGHGEFIIGKKNPDFINTNGLKIAIELYYPRHKLFFGQAKDGIAKWKQDRIDIFNHYGWKIEFFDETQINEKEILRRVG